VVRGASLAASGAFDTLGARVPSAGRQFAVFSDRRGLLCFLFLGYNVSSVVFFCLRKIMSGGIAQWLY
jgi:hypothetical protein